MSDLGTILRSGDQSDFTWLKALAGLAADAEEASPDAEGEIFAKLCGLLSSAPAYLSEQILSSIQYDRIEVLLDAQAYESAALHFLSDKFGYMMSSGPGRKRISISVWIPDLCEEITVKASSETLALIVGVSTALLHAYGSENRRDYEANLN